MPAKKKAPAAPPKKRTTKGRRVGLPKPVTPVPTSRTGAKTTKAHASARREKEESDADTLDKLARIPQILSFLGEKCDGKTTSDTVAANILNVVSAKKDTECIDAQEQKDAA